MSYAQFLLPLIFFSLLGCESKYKEIIYFDSAVITASDMEVTDSLFTANGMVLNESNYSFKSPWYITFKITPTDGNGDQVFTGVELMATTLDCNDSIAWQATYVNPYFKYHIDAGFTLEDFEAFHILE